jgi:maltose alpha-D-glucosyltransferase/alpha-amylase
MIDLWYKNAVIYCVDVETFMDSNGDGVGDFAGLAHRLDHIEALGATCLWLLPFYATPNRDNGYDVKDYYSVDPRLGTFGDFVEFTRAARDRGLRIIIDLVVNHTSIDHPWFQEARDPASPRRDWYVWSKEKPKDLHEGMVFPGVQEATWTWDEKAGAWYMHRFFKHQADLNICQPRGARGDRAHHGLLAAARRDRLPAGRRTLPGGAARSARGAARGGPAPVPRGAARLSRLARGGGGDARRGEHRDGEIGDYFGDGDRLQMIFNFLLNQHSFLALVRGSAEPILRVMKKTPKLPQIAQWGTFLRNHDELDLGRLSEAERAEVFRSAGAGGENARSSAAASDAAWRRCSVATVGGSPWRTA